MDSTIRVAVAGAMGRMGQEVVRAVQAQQDLQLVAVFDSHGFDQPHPSAPHLVVQEKLGEGLDATPADVLVEFTNHASAASHALSALRRGCSPVIGATGLTPEELKEIDLVARETGVPALYAPNFALGAVLMMKFAEMAAKWLPNVEIIEQHHEQKLDAPSGTAMLTAHLIQQARTTPPLALPEATLKVEGARGATVGHVPVHSVRLPGLVAHQEVIFGGTGETLTIRHDSLHRSSFMEGVVLGVRRVKGLDGLVVGLDKVLF